MAPPPERRSLRPFVLLEAATLLSGAGNGVALVVIPWLVLERTGSASSAGLVAAATALPLLASSLFSGTVVDTLGRRRTAVGADLLSAVSVALIPVVDRAMGLDLGAIMVLAVVGAVFDPAGVTARETMLPATAERAHWPLERVNGIHEAVWGAAFVLGPGIGGVLIALVGAADTLWIAAAGFTASAAMVAMVQVANSGPPVGDQERIGMWASTKQGLSFVRHDPLLLGITVILAMIISVYMPIEGVLLPVHFQELAQPGRLGAIVMAMSIGGIIGALAYSALGTAGRRSLVLRTGLLTISGCILVLAVLPPYPVMLAAAFGIGLSYGPMGPVINLAMQARSPEHMRGRVVGIITSTEYAAGPIGYLIVGAATARFGVRPTFLVVALVLLAVAIFGWFMRSLRELDGLPSAIDTHDPAEVLDAATAGPVPLIRPPRDPDQIRADVH